MIVYPARGIPAFVLHCVYGASRSSLLIESTDSMILVGCKHPESEGVFYIGGRDLCQIIEPVTFARCAFIRHDVRMASVIVMNDPP